MQIRDVSAAAIARTYTRQAGTAGGGAGRISASGADARPRTDSVAVSTIRQDVMRARAVAASQPDVRTDRVAALRQQVSSGAYQVDTHALAAKMLGS